MEVFTLMLPLFCKHYQGVNRAVMENSSTPGYKKTKLANEIRKAAAYRTEGSQPNTMGEETISNNCPGTQNKQKSINTCDGAPSWDAVATVRANQNPRC